MKAELSKSIITKKGKLLFWHSAGFWQKHPFGRKVRNPEK